MKPDDSRLLEERKARLEERLSPERQEVRERPVIEGAVSGYEVSGRVTALSCGGIGLVHQMVQSLSLAEAIDREVHVFKRHFPYHESDHVLNLAYNIMAGGTCIEDLELLRANEGYLDALGAQRIPDPTTAGDFLRRFGEPEILGLQRAIHATQKRVWKRLSRKERELAQIDVDGTIAPTDGECKEGMDLSYKGEWGYAPLLVSLANTQEPLFVVNRPGNAVSHSGAGPYMDAAVDLVLAGGKPGRQPLEVRPGLPRRLQVPLQGKRGIRLGQEALLGRLGPLPLRQPGEDGQGVRRDRLLPREFQEGPVQFPLERLKLEEVNLVHARCPRPELPLYLLAGTPELRL